MPTNIDIVPRSVLPRNYVIRPPALWIVFPLLLGLLSLALIFSGPASQDWAPMEAAFQVQGP